MKQQLLDWYKEIGIDEIIDENPINRFESDERVGIMENITLEQNHDVSESRKIANSANDIYELFELIKNFDGCKLKFSAQNTVYGDGVPESEILFVGEAPGANEDLQGKPFCGDSGKLLDMMLESINISRSKNAFITNNVFWRPPANRQPTKEELAICLPFLERIIGFINPKIIIMVGSVAASNLTGLNNNMAVFRSRPVEYKNQYLKKSVKAFTIYHPAYLLRSPSQKKNAWYDLITIEDFIKTNNIKL